MEIKFWKPAVTSQFLVCPVPYHMDTYRGCPYGCLFCFARDITTFARRNSEHKEFSYLVGQDTKSFKRWVDRTLAKEYDYKKAEEVAFKERVPVKIGATADPFPYAEKTNRITYEILKILHEIDYPVQMSTKNPEVLAEYAQDFINPNWTVSVSVTTMDEKFNKIVEPYAITPERKMKAIKKLTDMGIKVMIRVHPFIYPRILTDLDDIIKSAKEAGCWAFMTEGMKLRVSMPKNEQELFKTLGEAIGISDLRQFYKDEKNKCGSDYELSEEHKKEVLDYCVKIAKKYDVKFFSGDNYMYKVGDGFECCGTSVLRNYKTLGCDCRCKLHGGSDNPSLELQKCFVNFTRSVKNVNKTILEVCEEKKEESVVVNDNLNYFLEN